MTGYDKKALTLTADIETTVSIEVDFDHRSGWHVHDTVPLVSSNRTQQPPSGTSPKLRRMLRAALETQTVCGLRT